MFYITKLIVVGSLILIMSGCGNSNNANQGSQGQEEAQQAEKLRALEEKTMAVHDSIMPQMDSLMQLKQRLQTRLKKEDGGNKEAMKRQVDSLSAAREAMMNWMSRYSKEYKRLPDSAATSAKAEQLQRLNQDIRTLKKQWDQTLRNSVELLEEEKGQKPK